MTKLNSIGIDKDPKNTLLVVAMSGGVDSSTVAGIMKDEGYKVRLYVPFGTDWLPYTLRRLKEYKNLVFVIKNLIKEWKS